MNITTANMSELFVADAPEGDRTNTFATTAKVHWY